jgi:hypothetical protein
MNETKKKKKIERFTLYDNHRQILDFFRYQKRLGGSCLQWAWELQK